METMKTEARSETRDRNQLIIDHTESVKKVVLRMARRCPTWIPREDLVSAGMIGLVEAADRYDPTRDEMFWSFAEHRIRGAVLDELRRGDILPRRVRQLARKIAAVLSKLERDAGHPPSDEQVASELGMSIESYREDTWALRNHHVAPLDSQEATLVDTGRRQAPDDAADHNHTLARVRDSLSTLEPRDVRVLGMHFLEEMSFTEIAGVLGVTPSRVCQLLWRAIDRLRGALGCPGARRPRDIDGVRVGGTSLEGADRRGRSRRQPRDPAHAERGGVRMSLCRRAAERARAARRRAR